MRRNVTISRSKEMAHGTYKIHLINLMRLDSRKHHHLVENKENNFPYMQTNHYILEKSTKKWQFASARHFTNSTKQSPRSKHKSINHTILQPNILPKTQETESAAYSTTYTVQEFSPDSNILSKLFYISVKS